MPPEQLDRVAATDAISAWHILPCPVTPEVTVESSTQMDGICVTAPQERSSIKEAWELVNNYSGGVTLRGVTQRLFPEVCQDVQWGMHRCPQWSPAYEHRSNFYYLSSLQCFLGFTNTCTHSHTTPHAHTHMCAHILPHTHTCIHTHAPMCHTCQVVRNIQNKTLAPNAQSTQKPSVAGTESQCLFFQ